MPLEYFPPTRMCKHCSRLHTTGEDCCPACQHLKDTYLERWQKAEARIEDLEAAIEDSQLYNYNRVSDLESQIKCLEDRLMRTAAALKVVLEMKS